MQEAKVVSIKNIIDGIDDVMYCAFEASIINLFNKENPWFEKCKICNQRVYPNDLSLTTHCSNCNKDVTFFRKYMLKILVSDGEMDAHITTFEATEMLVGCDVSEYATEILKVHFQFQITSVFVIEIRYCLILFNILIFVSNFEHVDEEGAFKDLSKIVIK